MQVSPGPDGTTDWWARLPAATSAAAWAAVRDLADRYAKQDPALTVDQARADALVDLLLTNVTVTTKVTLGIPVITGPDAQTARDTAIAEYTAENTPPPPVPHGRRGSTDATRDASRRPAGHHHQLPGRHRHHRPGLGPPAIATGGQGLGREVLPHRRPDLRVRDPRHRVHRRRHHRSPAHRGPHRHQPRPARRTAPEPSSNPSSTAYRPSKAVTDFVATRDGTCRMWGCDRPATTCDLDHARPWPAGPTTPTNLAGLCRRHHRLKQRRRWTYQLAPDGTATWTSPTGKQRITHPRPRRPTPATTTDATASARPGGTPALPRSDTQSVAAAAPMSGYRPCVPPLQRPGVTSRTRDLSRRSRSLPLGPSRSLPLDGARRLARDVEHDPVDLATSLVMRVEILASTS